MSDSDYASLDEKAAMLSRLLKAFGFTFRTQSARLNVASTLVTALESETRLTDPELTEIQDSLFPLKGYEPPNDSQHEQEPLYGVSITCIGRLEAPADLLAPSAQPAPRSVQEIRLKHVELDEYEDSDKDWQSDSDVDEGSKDYASWSGVMQQIESPIMILTYSSDSQRAGFSCAVTFNPEVSDDQREVTWSCANYFLSNAGFPPLPSVLTDSWTTERDPIASVVRATNGSCSIEVELPYEASKSNIPFLPLTLPSVPGCEWTDLPLTKSGHVIVIDPPMSALAEICESIGVPEAQELIERVLTFGCSHDNPTTALGPVVRKLGGGGIQVYDDHVCNAEFMESSYSASIELDDTPVGAISIEITFGRNFKFSVFPPTPCRGDQQETLARQAEQIRRALQIPWDRIRAIARECRGD